MLAVRLVRKARPGVERSAGRGGRAVGAERPAEHHTAPGARAGSGGRPAAAAVVLCVACAAAWAQGAGPRARYEAITQLDATGQVVTCGVRARTFDQSGLAYAVELTLERGEEAPETVLRARSEVSMSPAPLPGAELHVGDLNSATLLAPVADMPPRSFEARGRLDESTGAQLVREFLLSGGDLVLRFRPEDPPEQVPVRGPADPEVFRAYLQCSGDLYRP